MMSDILVAFLFMALLFLRQVYILRQANKINYGPLMLAIGAISSVIHFIISPDTQNITLLLKESFFPLLVALLLYIVMNILHQNQQSENAKTQDEFTRVLVLQVSKLKDFVGELENRMNISQQEERLAQEEIREQFKRDINALDAIQINQVAFLDKFDVMDTLHNKVIKELADFTDIQVPSLDDVVHKHIDILRIAEQDHYNKLKIVLEKAVERKCEISEDMDELKEKLSSMKNISNDIAKAITRHTLQQLSSVTKDFADQILFLKSHAESIKTSLYEGENTLSAIRVQSEMIMKQMVLSSKKMGELENKNIALHDVYTTMRELMSDMEVIKADYVKSQSQLSTLSKELKSSEDERISAMKNQIESLSDVLSQRIDDSLEKLHEHYHIADEGITKSVQILAKKAQVQKGYTGA
jgi:hypothetical protein